MFTAMRSPYFLCLFLVSSFIQAQQGKLGAPLMAEDSVQQNKWVDSVYNSLSQQQRVGQLFMIDLFTNGTGRSPGNAIALAKEGKIGGIIFSKGGPGRQANLTNQLQSVAKVPLLIAMDAEWGLSMRLDSTFAYPYNMTLGAMGDKDIARQVGKRIGEHNRRLGVHINFAPVADINNNPRNPIIGNRSFGESREKVFAFAKAFAEGMQSTGVLATLKHFPGHGDTDQDSHKTLPSLNFDNQRLDSLELYPFKKLFRTDAAGVMVAHLNIPSLESRAGYPTSLSNKVVTTLLQEKLGFQGLIFTDALNMKGASRFDEPGEIELQAFLAGNDILLIPNSLEAGTQKIIEAIQADKSLQPRLERAVKKILRAKYLVGLHKDNKIKTKDLYQDLNTELDSALYLKSVLNATTLLKNKDALIPIKALHTKKIAYVELGDNGGSVFLDMLNRYTAVDHVKADDLGSMIKKLQDYNLVIIGYHKSDKTPWKDYKMTDKELTWLYEIARTNRVVLDLFVSPYVLNQIKTVKNIESIVLGYQNSALSQSANAQLIFGAQPFYGRLPVTAGKFHAGSGLSTKSMDRLGYGFAISEGLDSKMLQGIDSVARKTIEEKGTPGMQVIVARNGNIILDKQYGHHTYAKRNPVRWNDVYDLASLTKILATLPLVMELVEKGVLKMDTTLGEMLPELRGTNKEHITLQRMLSHYAQLQAWIPFHFETLDSATQKPSTQYYARAPRGRIRTEVTKDLYVSNSFTDTIFKRIANSELRKEKKYKYSDLPYYLLQRYLESYYQRPLEELSRKRYYQFLGANYLRFHPLQHFDGERIIPTELDTQFRGQLIHGYVHDQGAALMGGVGGHAGLFGNANDVAKIMQTYLQNGVYGGQRFLDPVTISKFNTCYYCEEDVRRGVGFDKPQLDEHGPTCGCISMKSFGHSGFTGTYAWADPDEGIVYVFLSNRIHPDAENKYLITENVRTDIQQIIYDSIID